MYIKSKNPENKYRINLQKIVNYVPVNEHNGEKEYCILFLTSEMNYIHYSYKNKEARDKELERIDKLLEL